MMLHGKYRTLSYAKSKLFVTQPFCRTVITIKKSLPQGKLFLFSL